MRKKALVTLVAVVAGCAAPPGGLPGTVGPEHGSTPGAPAAPLPAEGRGLADQSGDFQVTRDGRRGWHRGGGRWDGHRRGGYHRGGRRWDGYRRGGYRHGYGYRTGYGYGYRPYRRAYGYGYGYRPYRAYRSFLPYFNYSTSPVSYLLPPVTYDYLYNYVPATYVAPVWDPWL